MSDQKFPVTPPTPGREAYNIVTDTVAGPNIRKKDNLFQALTIAVCLILSALIGFLIAKDAVTGLIVGGFIGLLVGLFGSGIFLMIFRAVRHAQGRHN